MAAHLKRSFKALCDEQGLPMATVLEGLVGGWLAGRYEVDAKPTRERPASLYVPQGVCEALRVHCRTAEQRLSMRAALEELIKGWLIGRFQLPREDGDAAR